MNRVFLDANILFPNTTRSLFIWLHKGGVLEIYWSMEVWEEVFNAFKRSHPARETELRLTLTEKVIASFPECLVQKRSVVHPVGLRDPKDEHVICAAKACDADYLITNDSVLLNDPLAKGVTLIEADKFLVEVLAAHSSLGVIQGVRDHMSNLLNSKPSIPIYLQSLRKARLEKFADWLERRRKAKKLFPEIW